MSGYDLLVIGSGPAGQRAAIQAAKLNKRVAVIEQQGAIGGGCLHRGTIPSKTLREAVLYLTGWRQRGFYGRSYRVKARIEADDLMQRLEITTRHEIEVIQHQLFRNGIDVITGRASFAGPHTLRIETADDKAILLEAERILVAVGTRPARPPHVPFDHPAVIDSDHLVELETLPRTMVVMGAGVIGVEYASIFSTLDIEVVLVDERPTMLDFLDREVVDEFCHHLREHGVLIRLAEKVVSIDEMAGNRVRVMLASGKQVAADLALIAAGRQGNTEGLQLEKAGLSADARGRLSVNENHQTQVPHIYAAGDVIGFPSLASTSMEQGRHAACHAFGIAAQRNFKHFPFGIYTVPEMSVIGMTEQEARRQNIPYEIGLARMRETSRGQILGLREGLLKLIVALEDRRLLGVHVVGEGATELVHIGQAVMNLEGRLDYFLNAVFNYPTLAEAYKIAALDAWNRLPREGAGELLSVVA
jgi:NAD(P) transhydrogenase